MNALEGDSPTRNEKSDKAKDRQRQTKTGKDRQRQAKTGKDRQRQTKTGKDRQRQVKDRQRQAKTGKDRQRHTKTKTDKDPPPYELEAPRSCRPPLPAAQPGQRRTRAWPAPPGSTPRTEIK